MDKLSLRDGRELRLGGRTLVMGIVNVTPDSFYPASRSKDLTNVLDRVSDMIEAGVDILDVGGESTRPGSRAVALRDEMERVVPAVFEIRRHFDIPISVDTRKSEVAKAALDHGADLINDVSALRYDPALAAVVAAARVPVILMHMRGAPETMQLNVHFDDTMYEIESELRERISHAVSQGVQEERILIDPGIGFGKRIGDNLRILHELPKLAAMGFPIVVGASRKGFVGAAVGDEGTSLPVEERLSGSLAVAAYAAANGAHILRVHDVPETVHVVRMIHAIMNAIPETIGELAE
ncbi:MAG TPA: dihydropteroate synthase [Spirochaetia bacterium]|nr:dihydropteroate synthase [Spirochaetia bacterium]